MSAKRGNSKQNNNTGVVEHDVQELSYESMLPISSELEKYEGMLPGMTERLLTMVEERHKHIMKMEEKQIDQNADVNRKMHVDNIKGLHNNRLDIVLKYLVGILLGSSLLFCGFYAMNHGHENVAMVIFGGGFLTAASKFVSIIFTKDKSKDLKDK